MIRHQQSVPSGLWYAPPHSKTIQIFAKNNGFENTFIFWFRFQIRLQFANLFSMQEPHNRPIYLICIFNAALNTKSLSHIAIYMSIDLKPSVLVKIYVSVDIPMYKMNSILTDILTACMSTEVRFPNHQWLRYVYTSRIWELSINWIQVATFFSSPEHKVLKVSCCDQSMSVVLCLSFVIRLQQLFQKPSPPTPLGQWTRNLVGRIGVTYRSKIAKIILIWHSRWQPSSPEPKLTWNLVGSIGDDL